MNMRMLNTHQEPASPAPSNPRTVELANRILDYAAAQQMPSGAPLREVGLAKALNVSRTPVRAALRLLQEQGHAEAKPNRGVYLVKDAEFLQRAKLEVPPSTVSVLFSNIIRGYVAGTIPTSFSQSNLVQTLKVPRSQLAQVLTQMEHEGIILRTGQTYTFQPTLDNHTALRNSYQLREAVEPAGLRLPQFHADPIELAAFRGQHEQMLRHGVPPGREGDGEIFALDADFHEFLARSSGNPFFLQAMQHQNRLRKVIDIVSYEETLTRKRIGRWCQEHLNVIEALEAGDHQLAADLLGIHLRYATREIERLVSEYFSNKK